MLVERSSLLGVRRPSSWFCTGGTTGLPKLAMRRHGNEVANAWSVAQVLGDGIGPRKVVFCGLPLFHVNAVLVDRAPAVLARARTWSSARRRVTAVAGVIKRFWEIVEHHRINFFSGVPTLYSSLLQIPIGSHDVSSRSSTAFAGPPRCRPRCFARSRSAPGSGSWRATA